MSIDHFITDADDVKLMLQSSEKGGTGDDISPDVQHTIHSVTSLPPEAVTSNSVAEAFIGPTEDDDNNG